jgi:hypothetical protein
VPRSGYSAISRARRSEQVQRATPWENETPSSSSL